jgi:GxxExxY protein
MRMDRIKNKRELPHSDISEKIIGCCFEVMKELGSGFLENVYKNALFLAMKQKGLSVSVEQAFEVSFRGHKIGKYIADLTVENLIIVELKCCKVLLPEHQAQLINYLKASEKPVGLLVNFGSPKLEYKRLHHPDNFMELEECSSGLLTFLKPYAENKSLDSSSCPS